MANNKNFIAKNGVSTGDGYAMPDVRPSLLLDFANSKTLDPRITFTRGSTGTYWDGKTTTKAEENLITYSQDIVAGNWNITQLGVVDNQTAPDGTSTAQLFTPNTNHNYHYVYTGNSPVTTAPNTFSVYAKNNGANYAFLRSNTSGGYCGVNFDLSNSGSAAVEGPGNIDSYSATDVGNGWYRLTVTFNKTLAPQTQILINGNNTNVADTYNGNGTDGIYFWGAQLENRSSATAYTPTTSSPITKYQPVLQTAASGEARFDHDPVTGESKGLLIEEARTNRESSSVGNVSYVGQGTQRTNAAVAPDGTITALECIPNTTNTTHVFDQYGDPVLGDMTFSLFAKANGYSKVRLEYKTGSGSQYSRFDLSTGTVTANSNATGRIEDVGNGWYRISISFNCTVTGADIERFQILDDNYNTTFAGDGFSGMFIWGYQFEQGAFPTSYIPTSGSTVTRALDSCTFLDLSQIDYNQGNGTTMLIEAQTPDNATLRGLMNFSGGSEVNFYGICETDGTITGRIRSSSTYEVINTTVTGLSAGEYATHAMSVHFNNPKSAQTATNGTVSTADTSFSQTVPANMTRLAIGTISSSSYVINGCVKKAALYPKAFNSATLQAMTEA